MLAIFGERTSRAAGPDRTAPARPAGTRPAPRSRRLLVSLAGAACLAGLVAGVAVVAPLRHPHASVPAATAVRPSRPTPAAGMAVAMTAQVTPATAPLALSSTPPETPAPTFAASSPPHVAPVRSVAPARLRPAIVAEDATDDPRAASRAEVIAADRALRDAYDRAIDAGVRRGQLVAIRNRWAHLRATEYAAPAALLADYAELADRLDDASRYAEADLR